MADGRTELFIFMGAAFATLIGLFVLHGWYASYIDVRYQDSLATSGPAEGMVAARDSDEKLLGAGKVPIAQAMQVLAQRGRAGFGSVSPNSSDDLSALSGWIRSPSFKPVVAHPIRTARAGRGRTRRRRSDRRTCSSCDACPEGRRQAHTPSGALTVETREITVATRAISVGSRETLKPRRQSSSTR